VHGEVGLEGHLLDLAAVGDEADAVDGDLVITYLLFQLQIRYIRLSRDSYSIPINNACTEHHDHFLNCFLRTRRHSPLHLSIT